jgi:hypothetical protein
MKTAVYKKQLIASGFEPPRHLPPDLPFSPHVLVRARTLAVLARWAARVSAPLRGGR